MNINHYVKEKLAKAMKETNVNRKLSNVLHMHSLVTIYKSFVRPNVDYGDIYLLDLCIRPIRELKACILILLLQSLEQLTLIIVSII